MVAQINWRNCSAAWGKTLAENASTSADALMELALNADVGVRIAVVDNQNTSAATAMLLAKDGNADLRFALAENHNIHADVLRVLADDDNPFVAHRAKKTLRRLSAPEVIRWRSAVDQAKAESS